MRLYELAWACRLYGPMASFDTTLDDFRKKTSPAMHVRDPAHREALFIWLNSWGCRQFAKVHHAGIASDSLVRWAETWLHRLPEPGTLLTELKGPDLDVAADAYSELQASVASERTRGPDMTRVTFGPTGAAKTLFALRPDVFPPWDEPIRQHLGHDSTGASFRAYLTGVSADLRAVATEAEVDVASLPVLVDRPYSSPPKLIDEYNWVVMTRGFTPPSARELSQWLSWAGRDGSGSDPVA